MSHIVNALIDFCTNLIGDWGLPAVFLLMVLQSACIPVPSEAIMLFAGFAVSKGHMSLLGIVTVGVAGNILGSCFAYGVGRYGGRPFVDRYGKYVLLRHHHLEVAERWFARYGPVTVFFSRMIPIVCSFISLPAGFAKMTFRKFALFTLAGCVPWVLMLGYVGIKVGDNWVHIQKRLDYLNYVVIVAAVLLIVWWALRRRGRRAAAGAGADPGAGGTGD
jgi:membrane protein DedA with SNARE-associated domain